MGMLRSVYGRVTVRLQTVSCNKNGDYNTKRAYYRINMEDLEMFKYEIKKEDCKLQICVTVFCHCETIHYTISDILVIQKGKRKPVSICAQVRDSWEYRRREYSERTEYVKEQYLKYCTEDDIKAAVEYAYSLISPKIEDVSYRAN